MAEILLKIIEEGEIPLSVEDQGDIELVLETPYIGGDYSNYEGPYEVTPSREAQVLPTARKAVQGNIVVDAIPSNYGLIEWDGSKLRVS